MTRRILFFVFLAELLSAQSGTVPCCHCEGSGRTDDVVCLDGKGMRDHVDRLEPLKPSGLDKGLNLAGIVVVEVRFDSAGKVDCARAKSGHPIAISAALTAIKKWTFKPIVSGGVANGGCGVITIKYRLRDQGSSTKLQ
jgi:TonB family protein